MAISLACAIIEEDDDPIDHVWVCKTIGEMVPKFCKFMGVFLDKFKEWGNHLKGSQVFFTSIKYLCFRKKIVKL